MRFVIARRLGVRGEGLGNEMLPWAKGFIASQVLNAKLIGPSWGLNKRQYYRNFGTSRLDFLAEDLLRHLPHHAFTAGDYIESGEIDFGRAIEQWARRRGLLNRSAYTVVVDGMYGGYPSIRNARPFLWAKLLSSRDALRNVYEIASTLDRRKLFVAVHIRSGGDFAALGAEEEARGRFNIRIPGEWYLSTCAALRSVFGEDVQFHFFTDRGGLDFDEAVRRFNPGQQRQSGLTECSDLVLMAQADLRVCSISSYSLIAGFLSGGPYLWYEPQLTYADRMYTLWGREVEQQRPSSPTQQSIEWMKSIESSSLWQEELRGYCVKPGETLPAGLIAQLRRKLIANDRSSSLLEYGALPDWVER
jgi:hypothetical protein